MAEQKDESVQQVEQSINQNLKFSHRLKQGLGIAFHPIGRHYTRFKENWVEGAWLWFTIHKGYRFILLIFVLTVSLTLAYFDYPFLLIDVLITPIIAIMVFPFAAEEA